MIRCRSAIAQRLGASRPLLFTVILAGILLALVSAVRFQAPELLGMHKTMTDFDAFYIAGRLAADGRVSDAYHMTSLIAAQRAMTGTTSFMPWTYPPPFTLLMQGISALPIGVAFLLFVLSSFAFYLYVLHRIVGRWLAGVVLAVAPVILLNLRTGQNGFLIAGLIGTFLLMFRGNRGVAGLPLGLLVIKPHLAVGAGLFVLLRRRWSVAIVAGAVALAMLAIPTLIYGLSIWTDFRSAVAEAGGFLAAGYYQLFRMTSAYSAANSLGIPPVAAMALQVASAVVSLGILAYACVKNIAYDRLAALVCAASVCVSPYSYDYDLAILGVGVAFIMPELLERSTTRQFWSLLVLSWIACGYGLAWSATIGEDYPGGVGDNRGISLIMPVLWLLFWLAFRSLTQTRTVGNVPDALRCPIAL